jgi:hypothetical protein
MGTLGVFYNVYRKSMIGCLKKIDMKALFFASITMKRQMRMIKDDVLKIFGWGFWSTRKDKDCERFRSNMAKNEISKML